MQHRRQTQILIQDKAAPCSFKYDHAPGITGQKTDMNTQSQASSDNCSRALKCFIYAAVRDIDLFSKNDAVVMAEMNGVNSGGFINFHPKPYES